MFNEFRLSEGLISAVADGWESDSGGAHAETQVQRRHEFCGSEFMDRVCEEQPIVCAELELKSFLELLSHNNLKLERGGSKKIPLISSNCDRYQVGFDPFSIRPKIPTSSGSHQ